MDSRQPKKRNSAMAEDEFRIVDAICFHVSTLPQIYKDASMHDGTFNRDLMQLLVNIDLKCNTERKKTKQEGYGKNYINLKHYFANILKILTDAFIISINIENHNVGVGMNYPLTLAATINTSESGYHASRLLGLLISEVHGFMTDKSLPNSSEVYKYTNSKERATLADCSIIVKEIQYRDKSTYPRLQSLARSPIGRENSELVNQIYAIVTRMFHAPEIYDLVANKEDKKNHELELMRLMNLHKVCNDVMTNNEGVERDAQGKFARILKILSDELLKACNIAEPGPAPGSGSSSPRGESPRGDSPRDNQPSGLTSSSDAVRQAESPRVRGGSALGSPRMAESPRPRSGSMAANPTRTAVESPRTRSASQLLRRSISSFTSLRPGSPRAPRTIEEIAEAINNDESRHHYARLLGLMLGEMVRLMERPDMPNLRQQDRLLPQYQLAQLIEFPASKEENYRALSLTTPTPEQAKIKSPQPPPK